MSSAAILVPRSLEEVFPLLGPDGTLLVGGGTALSLLVKTRMVAPRQLVWLGRTPTLQKVTVENGVLRIGAGVTLHGLSESELVRRHCPSLARAASEAANVRVRAVATLGGHLVHADPRQDLPPVLLAVGATVGLASASTAREVQLDDFLISFMETRICPGEVLTHVCVPVDTGRREVYLRFSPRSCEDFPTVGAAAAVTIGATNRIVDARVGVGAVGSRATVHRCLRPPVSEEELTEGLFATAAAAVAEETEPMADHRGSEHYKRHMVFVLVKRALSGCVAANQRAT